MAEFNWQLPETVQDGIKYSIVYLPMDEIRPRITGTGRIHGAAEKRPWISNQHRINDIWIGEGITEIGDMAFCDHSKLKRVWLPETMSKIGIEVFARCPKLEEVIFERTPDRSSHIDIGHDALPEWALDY